MQHSERLWLMGGFLATFNNWDAFSALHEIQGSNEQLLTDINSPKLSSIKVEQGATVQAFSMTSQG